MTVSNKERSVELKWLLLGTLKIMITAVVFIRIAPIRQCNKCGVVRGMIILQLKHSRTKHVHAHVCNELNVATRHRRNT